MRIADYVDDRHALRVWYQTERCRVRNLYANNPGIRDAVIAILSVDYRRDVETLRAYHIWPTYNKPRVIRRGGQGFTFEVTG